MSQNDTIDQDYYAPQKWVKIDVFGENLKT